ncbi:MAG: rhamnulokinase family protein [Christensenella sp.]
MKKNGLALAIDLGASGGKLFVGELKDGKATFTPIHKFQNKIVLAQGKAYWDFLRIFDEIKFGYALAQREFDGQITSVAIDSWCNDYALISKNGTMIETPRNYRDSRTFGWVERAYKLMPQYEVYKRTGQQFERFETAYHLLAESEQDSDILGIAKELIFVPDYLSHLLGAKKYTEYTIASVSNLYNIADNKWDDDILMAYGISKDIFMPIVHAGDKVGEIASDVTDELRVASADIYAVGSHDTASAVVAVPAADDEEFIFISSGTWSLVGAELRNPIMTEESMKLGFGNEGGVMGRNRYICNVTGLWIIQECVRIWGLQGKKYSFAELAEQASKAMCDEVFIDPDDERLFEPANMPEVVAQMAREQGYTPKSDVEIVRIITQSLACKYRYVIDNIEHLTGKKFPRLHIIGGGSKNAFLDQLTADYLHKPVYAGPADATGIGNILTQWIGRGILKNLKEARQICAESCDIQVYQPCADEKFERNYQKFLHDIKKA